MEQLRTVLGTTPLSALFPALVGAEGRESVIAGVPLFLSLFLSWRLCLFGAASFPYVSGSRMTLNPFLISICSPAFCCARTETEGALSPQRWRATWRLSK